MPNIRRLSSGLAAATALFLAACGGGGDSDDANLNPDRGALFKSPPTRLAALTAAQFNASLSQTTAGSQLLQIAGTPSCGLDVRYMQYGTVGAKDENVTATGAIFVPTGNSEKCSGKRPILLYAHGTTAAKDYNIALLGSTNAAAGEAGLVAAIYAAQGYIVVAPNYAGYEASTLDYHAYLNADQQSKDMIDALTAARRALKDIRNGTSDDGRLFITGYSAGGHVAMATHRALQAAGKTVTASVGSSGPYAIATQVDAAFTGKPNLGGTVFTPLLVNSWQRAYGNLYDKTTDIYTAAYAGGIASLLPSLQTTTELFTSGKLPQLALLGNDSPGFALATPQFQVFYGEPEASLINTTYATAVFTDIVKNPCPYTDPAAPLDCKPESTLRIAALKNDLRNWVPSSPLLMCGGNADPTVFFTNAQLTQAWFQDKLPAAAKALTTLVDIDSAPGGAGDPFALAKGGFAQAKAATAAAAGSDPVAQARAVTSAYHGSLVPPFCNAVARGFFSQF